MSVLHQSILPMTDGIPDRSIVPPYPAVRDPVSSNSPAIDGTILAKKYRLQSSLGRGGFGITFLARNLCLPGQPPCVIKKLSPRTNTNPDLLATLRWRFYLEAKSLSRLTSHGGIPSLLDYFRIGSDLYLVEQYIPGRNLTEIIRKQRRFSESEVENFLVQMLHLLEYIHSHHLIHRDIKPSNIILCKTDLRFVLVDFGAVKDLQPPSNIRKNAEIVSRAIGTPGFAPPEQLADRAVYASDIYGLGMTCIYLLTGKEPTQLPIDPISCELIWVDEVEINVDLSEIISKMVRISLVDRYQSASEIAIDIDNRTIRSKFRKYLHKKQEIANSSISPDPNYYPPVVDWALEILAQD